MFSSSTCCCLVNKLCPIFLWHHGLQLSRFLCPWDFSGKNTGVGCHFILQGIFLTQGPNPCLLHWQADSLPLSHQRSPLSSTSFNKCIMACVLHFSIIQNFTILKKKKKIHWTLPIQLSPDCHQTPDNHLPVYHLCSFTFLRMSHK